MNDAHHPADLLIVEDSPTQAQQLTLVLEQRGYRVHAVRDGQQALAWLADRPTSLVISDVVMPEMDGYALCRTIKQDANLRDTPVLLLTSLSDPADVVKGLEAGADSFIFKPFDERYLLARVEYLLANRHLRSDSTQMGVEIFLGGRRFFITSDRLQILNLLLSTYEAAVQRNQELSRVQQELTDLNEHLEATVRGRTRELALEVDERKRAEATLQDRLARLQLLRHITRAISARLDLREIFKVVTDHLEQHLPLDLCAIATRNGSTTHLTVQCVGAIGESRAPAAGLSQLAQLPVDDQVLAGCFAGALVHEADLSAVHLPFARQLADTGLRSAVVAPLQVDEKVFGIIVAARDTPYGFSGADREFLAQLSEHVALAVHQAELHSDLQRAYDELSLSQRAVQQHERLRALGQMASGIAHDINNALSPVALYTESLLDREQGLSERGRQQLETIQRAIEDVAETVARMREFYRPRQSIPDASQPVGLNPLVRHVLELTRARWRDMPQQMGLLIEVLPDLDDTLPLVRAAENEVREALTNLVLNAVDAMPVGGKLTIRTRHLVRVDGTEHVVLEVSDTGVGMDEDTRRRCLEPFFTTKGDRGTGLGLAMVYGFLQRHGAQIEIDSAPGRGTTVRMLFNLSADDSGPASDWGALDGPAAVTTLAILLIDDDPLVLNSLSDTLQAEGHQVKTTLGGREGIEAFSAALGTNSPFDAVITDLGMPNVDGRQVAQAVKSMSPNTPVIMLTGWGRRMSDAEEHPDHVDHLLSKPPKMAALRSALSQRSTRSA